MAAVQRTSAGSLIYIYHRQNSPCHVHSKRQPNAVKVVACVNLQFSLVTFPPFIPAFYRDAPRKTLALREREDVDEEPQRFEPVTKQERERDDPIGGGTGKHLTIEEELPLPPVGDIKIEIKLRHPYHVFSLYCLCNRIRSERRFPFREGCWWLITCLHTICPFPVPNCFRIWNPGLPQILYPASSLLSPHFSSFQCGDHSFSLHYRYTRFDYILLLLTFHSSSPRFCPSSAVSNLKLYLSPSPPFSLNV